MMSRLLLGTQGKVDVDLVGSVSISGTDDLGKSVGFRSFALDFDR